MELARVDRARLERMGFRPQQPAKARLSGKIVLLAGDGLGSTRIARAVGKSEPTVRRWLTRFREGGVDGLLRDATRPPGKKPLPRDTVARVVHLTLHERPPNATHWSARRLAQAVGIGHGAVQKIWAAHGLKPHLVRRFKLSSDPHFVEKLRDVVGLYVDPPEHAIVLSVDEKSQIQARDRTQPGLPLKKGRAGTMTHDYKRHGTTTLFAALDVLDGTVIGQCMLKHRSQEFIRFLRRIDRATPADLDLHLILDNYAAHKTQAVKRWLARHLRFHFIARLPRRLGPTRSRRCSLSSPPSASSAVPSARSSSCTARSTPIWPNTTPTPSPSSGPSRSPPSSTRSPGQNKRWSQCTSISMVLSLLLTR
jgi:transposase